MAEKKKALRNKTIDFSLNDGKQYFDKCINVSKPATIEDVIDKTINGDSFEVLKLLPTNSIDLLIVDPLYNIDKSFSDISFKKMNIVSYEAYTDSWVNNPHLELLCNS